MSENIYDDLRGTDLGENILRLERTNQALQRHIEKLEGDILKLCTELTEMKRVQQNLTRNISELFKTARAEISRKDKMIADLRSELDSLVFRKQRKVTPSEPLKRPNESHLSDSESKRQKSEDSCTSRGTQVTFSSKSSEDSYTSRATRVRRQSEHEDHKHTSEKSRRNNAVHDRKAHGVTSRSTHRDSRYANSRSRGRHYSRRRSRDRSSSPGHRRSASHNKTKRTDTSGKADTTRSVGVDIKRKAMEAKTVTNSVSSSNSELQPRGEVTAQEDLIDSTVPSSHQPCSSQTTESSFIGTSEPGQADALAPVKEPAVLNVLSAAVKVPPVVLNEHGDAVLSAAVKVPPAVLNEHRDAVLSANNSAVVEGPTVLKESCDAALSESNNSGVVKESVVLIGNCSAALSVNNLTVVKEPESCDSVPAVNNSAVAKESAVLNEGCASASNSSVVKEPAVLNESCTSANNSPVGRKPVRRRRCVVKIID